MVSHKTWIVAVLALASVIIAIVVIFNYVVDPFQQYRKPSLYRPSYDGDARYLVPGMAKNYDYDTILIGSSMCENFSVKDINEALGGKSIKLTIPGASAFEISSILDTAIKTGKVKQVLIGLDLFAFSGTPNRLRYGEGSLPFYLYDSNFFNDIKYLANLFTIRECLKIIWVRNSKSTKSYIYDFDNAFSWFEKSSKDFNRSAIISSWKNRKTSFNKDFNKQEYSFAAFKKSFDANLLPFIKNNERVRFIIFYPPYSILTWKDIQEKQWIDDALSFKEYIFKSTLMFKNLKIYDFQGVKNITHNLDNYMDVSHYSPSINNAILKAISKDEHVVTSDNFVSKTQEVMDQVKSLDLVQFLGENI